MKVHIAGDDQRPRALFCCAQWTRCGHNHSSNRSHIKYDNTTYIAKLGIQYWILGLVRISTIIFFPLMDNPWRGCGSFGLGILISFVVSSEHLPCNLKVHLFEWFMDSETSRLGAISSEVRKVLSNHTPGILDKQPNGDEWWWRIIPPIIWM